MLSLSLLRLSFIILELVRKGKPDNNFAKPGLKSFCRKFSNCGGNVAMCTNYMVDLERTLEKILDISYKNVLNLNGFYFNTIY